jgi:hypothetical protein
MADGGTFDFSELNKLTADFTASTELVTSEAKKSLQQTAIETKKSWAADAKKGVRGGRYAPTIDYTESEPGAIGGKGTLEVEIGPDIERYGGKTGKGGLVPSFGIFDDPESKGDIRATPSRARVAAAKFAEKQIVDRMETAVDRSLKKRNL